MNTVHLIGRLARDCETRFLNDGMAITKTAICVEERYKDRDGNWIARPNFFDLQLWGKRGEAFGKFHQKGTLAAVSGHLRHETWDDKTTGEKRSKVLVVVDDFDLVTPKPDSAPNREGADSPQPADGSGIDTPF